jgi:hypothetical protein
MKLDLPNTAWMFDSLASGQVNVIPLPRIVRPLQVPATLAACWCFTKRHLLDQSYRGLVVEDFCFTIGRCRQRLAPSTIILAWRCRLKTWAKAHTDALSNWKVHSHVCSGTRVPMLVTATTD